MEPLGNPIITHKFTTDPSVLVHDDTIYLYTGHDEAPIGASRYVMNEWLCFSSDDLKTWTEHAVPLKSSDFSWARGGAYAPKVIERDGRFFFYAPVTHATIKGRAIGVAVSDDPRGPFRDAIGEALITGSMLNSDSEFVNIDPTVLIDDDGHAHIFWGKGACYYARLKPNMIALDGPIDTVDLPGFQEGAHVHKRGGWYDFSVRLRLAREGRLRDEPKPRGPVDVQRDPERAGWQLRNQSSRHRRFPRQVCTFSITTVACRPAAAIAVRCASTICTTTLTAR